MSLIPYDIPAEDLLPGEKVLWYGRPATRSKLQLRDLSTVIPGLFFMGFGLTWMIAAFAMGTSGKSPQLIAYIFPFFALPFVGLGFWSAFGPLILRNRRSANTLYVLTDQRVIRILEGNLRRTQAYDVAKIIGTEKEVGRDGTGSIFIKMDSVLDWDG